MWAVSQKRKIKQEEIRAHIKLLDIVSFIILWTKWNLVGHVASLNDNR